MKKLLLLLALFAAPAFATPLGYTVVSGSHTQDSTGTLVQNATISFAPVNNNGAPISFRANGAGQVIDQPVTAQVVNGVFSIQLADTALTDPANVCYSVTIVSNVSGKQLLGSVGYTCVQPTGDGGQAYWCTSGTPNTCNFDLYIPNETALLLVSYRRAGSDRRDWSDRHSRGQRYQRCNRTTRDSRFNRANWFDWSNRVYRNCRYERHQRCYGSDRTDGCDRRDRRNRNSRNQRN
jgi:hypothetical protein